jgi:hypothetical protein
LDSRGDAPADSRGPAEIVRIVENRLGNQLARVVAHCELIADDPALPDEVRERARRAMVAAFEAAETLRALLQADHGTDPMGRL